MAPLDGVLEAILALTSFALAANIAFAVLVALYAVFFVGGSALAIVIALVFVGFGAVIVSGFLQLYLGGGSTAA